MKQRFQPCNKVVNYIEKPEVGATISTFRFSLIAVEYCAASMRLRSNKLNASSVKMSCMRLAEP